MSSSFYYCLIRYEVQLLQEALCVNTTDDESCSAFISTRDNHLLKLLRTFAFKEVVSTWLTCSRDRIKKVHNDKWRGIYIWLHCCCCFIIVWCSPGLIRFEQETGETMLGGEVFSGSEETPGLVSSSAPHHLVLPSLVTREIISQNYFSKLFFKIISAQNSPFQCRCSPSHWTLQ